MLNKRSIESRERTSKALKGHIISEATRIKIGNANKGKIRSEEAKNKISVANKGKKRTEETRLKLSNANKGSKNPNWNGGNTRLCDKIRTSIEGNLWRNSVFSRDNYTCQKCETRGCALNAHHIKNFSEFSELRFAIDNGITFCKKCHKKFHIAYGRKNNTKEQILSFLSY